MGLNESYNTVRRQILLINPLPFVNQTYSKLVQEESQRQHSPSAIGSDLISLHSANVANVIHKNRFNGTCDHCKIKGHKRENYYKIIGYPIDFKFSKKKANNASGFIVNNASVSDSAGGSNVASDVGVVT
ncbi:hypothetical protein J1N35_034816, partial [Gossypium stocksii]